MTTNKAFAGAKNEKNEIAIVGGGLAGLTAALLLARKGRKVILYEKASHLGGRAASHKYGDFVFNQGPHALYKAGEANKILQELGIEFKAKTVRAKGLAISEGKTYPLPLQPKAILSTGVLSTGGKLEFASFLSRIITFNPQKMEHLTLQAWLDQEIHSASLRRFLLGLNRVLTYSNAPNQQSASLFVNQFRLSLKGNVMYLDGGWQTLVSGLKQAAEAAGVTVCASARVEQVERTAKERVLHLSDGSPVLAEKVILACAPFEAAKLLQGEEQTIVCSWAESGLPVKAACLDLALRRLPQPENLFAFGIDDPLYFSVHSAYASFGPEGNALIHAAKYLDPLLKTDPKADERELETMLDLLQPGWREEILERRFLPDMVVYNRLVSAAEGGAKGRPGPAVPGRNDLFVIGDWVGPDGLLVDAALASASRAVDLIDGN